MIGPEIDLYMRAPWEWVQTYVGQCRDCANEPERLAALAELTCEWAGAAAARGPEGIEFATACTKITVGCLLRLVRHGAAALAVAAARALGRLPRTPCGRWGGRLASVRDLLSETALRPTRALRMLAADCQAYEREAEGILAF